MKNFFNFTHNHEYSRKEINKIIKFITELCKYETKQENITFKFTVAKNILNNTDFNVTIRSTTIYSNETNLYTNILYNIGNKLNMHPSVNIMVNTFGRATNNTVSCTFEFTEKNKQDILSIIEGNKLGLL